MSLSSCDTSLLDYASATNPNLGNARSPNAVDSATRILADPVSSQFYNDDEPIQDIYTYYKAFVSSASPAAGRTTTFPSHDGSTTNKVDQDISIVQGLEEQHVRPRSTPYSLAVRFANRPNGAPLATIVEHGSVSTLNSHGSLLSIGRFPSIRAVENVSPRRTRQGARRSLDEKALDGIQEETLQEHNISSRVEVTDLGRRRGQSDPLHKAGSPAQLLDREPHQLDAPQLPDIAHEFEHNGLRGFLRGFLQNVRSGSRSRSHNSSSSSAADAPTGDRRPDPGHFSPLTLNPREDVSICPDSSIVTRASASGEHSGLNAISRSSIFDTNATNRKSVSTGASSAGVYPPKLHLPLPSTNQKGDALDQFWTTQQYQLVSHILPPQNLSNYHSGKGVASTVRSVLPAPRDPAPDHVLADATTLLPQHNREEISAQHTGHGVPFYRLDAPSSRDINRARDANQNASFCSTMSTSYSGTVLGVDLDLQHDSASRMDRRSLTPVWFTPIENTPTEKSIDTRRVPRRSGSGSGSCPRAHEQTESKQLPPGSMTSSALSAILPIAAAEGIVRPNFKTPQLSFFTPSGNLIQTEENTSLLPTKPSSSSQCPYTGAPTTSTSFYGGDGNEKPSPAYNALSAAIGLPPARPALVPVPMTTPPQSSAPLPYHLRHHHNYQHPEASQITSSDAEENEQPHLHPQSIIRPGSAIKGCGGVVRRDSLTPRSGTPFIASTNQGFNGSRATLRSLSCISIGGGGARKEHDKSKDRSGSGSGRGSRSRRKGSSCNDIVSSSSPLLSAPAQSRKGNTLKKRRRDGVLLPLPLPPPKPQSQPQPQSRSQSRFQPHRRNVSSIGAVTSHAMRVFFCQPYDGAGNVSSADIACGRIHVGDHDHDQCHDDDNAYERRRKVRESLTPNVRVVDADTDAEAEDAVDGGSGKVKERSGSGASLGVVGT
ncbi:hypothetical protein CC80DRAFT_538198 [Byssothecium circinans]|uniref:Uncharacterized protein n=1 Tax=Byssothecium circinans TaxID=147558 RepID=A0A6A5TKR7_9PLEO|nr:hypothetical protein CC80DRAFT_538198 [Byssothecium circinans]